MKGQMSVGALVQNMLRASKVHCERHVYTHFTDMFIAHG